MTTFRICINGQWDEIKAKHIKDGNYYCKLIKTGNIFGIKWINTLHDDYSESHSITQFWPTSQYANNYPVQIKIIKH